MSTTTSSTASTYDHAVLKAELTTDERRMSRMYTDTTGNKTLGIGHNVSIAQTDFVIDAIYECDVVGCEKSLDQNCPWWRGLDPVRQRVIMNMMFNMGWGELRTFVNTLKAMEEGQWATAAVNMLASKWAGQVGQRAHRLAIMMLTGETAPDAGLDASA